jgi:hypothetical protein
MRTVHPQRLLDAPVVALVETFGEDRARKAVLNLLRRLPADAAMLMGGLPPGAVDRAAIAKALAKLPAIADDLAEQFAAPEREAARLEAEARRARFEHQQQQRREAVADAARARLESFQADIDQLKAADPDAAEAILRSLATTSKGARRDRA